MTEPIEILRATHHVVVQDFPSRDVPDELTRAGLSVTIYGGPDETDVSVSELVDGAIVLRPVGRYPASADLFCSYRPLAELDAIITEARRLGAATVWRQVDPGDPDPDAETWRTRIEQAGLGYLDTPPIEAVARALSA